MSEERAIHVTSDNFVEADVDTTFAHVVKQVGTNAFRHDRSLIPLDKQPAVTMNRDTVYSFGAFYAPKGTTITLPESRDGRYQSAMIMQTDHYIDQVFYGPGTFEIVSQTEFVGIVVRTEVDAASPDDLSYVHELQDGITVNWPEGVTPRDYQRANGTQPALRRSAASIRRRRPRFLTSTRLQGRAERSIPRCRRWGLPWRSASYLRNTPSTSIATSA